MDKQEPRERYEATGEERFYEQAKPLYEQALARDPGDAGLLREYGYLLECHGRYAIRAAITHYQQAVDADPRSQKTHLQLIGALAAVQDLDERVLACYEQRIAEDPGDPAGIGCSPLPACAPGTGTGRIARSARACWSPPGTRR